METETEGSDAAVYLPVSIEEELEFSRSASDSGLPDELHLSVLVWNYHQHEQFSFRVLKEAGKKAQIRGITHQMLRRTCSNYMAQLTTLKDVQATCAELNPTFLEVES